jgi:hypothetical protein
MTRLTLRVARKVEAGQAELERSSCPHVRWVMIQRRLFCAALLATCLGVVTVIPACGRPSGPTVTSAVRTELLRMIGSQEVYSDNPRESLVLVLNVDGFGSKAFHALPPEAVYVALGEQRYRVQSTGSSMSVSSSGKVTHESVELIAVVPRSALHFTLFLGALPPLAFTADTAILPEVRRPK